MRRSLLLVAFFITSAASAQSYLSPNPPPNSIEDRFRLEVALFRGSYDTSIRLDNVTTNAGGITVVSPGTEVSGESDLGLASSQYLGQLELTLLPSKHHMVRLSGLSMRREAQAILTRDINWGNSTYRAGERVDSHLNISMTGLTYGYLPFRNDKFELGLSLGIQIASVNANAEVRSRSIRADESAVGPVPLFGLETRYDFTPRWSVDARIQYLSLNLVESAGVDVSGASGSVIDWRVALRWRQNQHFLYGLGFRKFNLDVLSTTTNPAGTVSLALTGPMLFIQASL